MFYAINAHKYKHEQIALKYFNNNIPSNFSAFLLLGDALVHVQYLSFIYSEYIFFIIFHKLVVKKSPKTNFIYLSEYYNLKTQIVI